MESRSLTEFSTGVPVSAHALPNGSFRQAKAVSDSAFLIRWASSRTTMSKCVASPIWSMSRRTCS